MRTTLSALALLACGSAALEAQRARHFEVGAFGTYTRYDDAFLLADKGGGGVRFGYLFSERLGLEADLVLQSRHTVSGTTAIRFEPLIASGSLVLNLPVVARNSAYVLGGYSLVDFGATSPYDFTDHAIHGAVGDRLFIGERLALRVEARVVYTPQTEGALVVDRATHLVGSAGISLFQSGGPARPRLDADKDLVEDRRDACPDTPLGAAVDRRGCPGDADADGVFNGIDQCSDTPQGASVNALGCPGDADADLVLDGRDQCPDTPRGATVDPNGCPSDTDADKVFDGIDQCPATPAGATVDATGCPADADGDAVLDGLDRCPGTPAGVAVDAAGCPQDGDQDKVPDGIDQCPDTPLGIPVDARGCTLDSDGDGVHDGLDRCPNTPAGTPVSPVGCPLLGDADGDGVDDGRDRCPATPAGTQVDLVGCPVLFREEREGRVAPLVLQGVNFQTGRSVLTRESYAALDQVAASLLANPDIKIEIAGHTDSTGSRTVNLRLSQARAWAVRAYLARKGVSPTRMIARGYGPERPVAPNATPEGRAMNRRVELHKLP